MEFRKMRFTWMSRAAFVPVIAVIASSVAFALVLTGSIHGNTVNYKVSGLEPGDSYLVTVEHDTTGQSSQHNHTADSEGAISGSGAPGASPINPGDSVTVTVFEAGDTQNPIGSKTFTKDGPEGTPWWAYTGVGTVYYWIFGLC